MKGWVEFAALKQAVSLEAVLRHYRLPKLRSRGVELYGRCPIHRGERDDSFRANLGKNVFQCFACQARGNILDFVAAMERCSLRQAALLLQGWFAVPEPAPSAVWRARRATAAEGRGQLARKKEGQNRALAFVLKGVDGEHRYLAERGIDPATAAVFGVGFYGGPGLMSGRIVIPIHNVRGDIVAYAGRAIDQQLPKYKLPAGFHKGCEVFNFHRAAATASRSVIVVEGYFDCMRLWQAGLPYGVAVMGSSLSIQQEKILLDRFDRVVLLLDGDEAGRKGSLAITAQLSARCLVKNIALPEGTQPDQLSPAVIHRMIEEMVMPDGSFRT
jgi:DNA primase